MAQTSCEDFLAAKDPAFRTPPVSRREALPLLSDEEAAGPHIWDTIQELLKQGSFSKYLNRGIFPIKMHEPESELMRRAEGVFAASILNKAAKEEKGSLKRLLLVTVHNIAQCVGICQRVSRKAIRPVDRETFEFVCTETGCKILVEDVHNDPDTFQRLSSWKIWGQGWTLEAQTLPVIKFSATPMPRIDYAPNFRSHICFEDGDFYNCDLPSGSITGLTINKPEFAFKGSARVEHEGSKFTTEVDLSEPSLLSAEPKHRVKGKVLENGKKVDGVFIRGCWNTRLSAVWKKEGSGKTETVLWEEEDIGRKLNAFNLGKDSIQLNHLDAALLSVLPPTDSRLRTDLRALELGRFASAEKDMHRYLEGSLGIQKPMWFAPEKESRTGLKYRYKGGYWEARAAKATGDKTAWAGCPDIFNLGAAYDQPTAELRKQ